MTKQCQTQTDPYDGLLQINGYFYSSSTFSELKTRKRKKKHVGFMYLQEEEEEEKKERSKTISHP